MASQGKRFVNYAIDCVCIFLCASLFYVIIVLIENFVVPNAPSIVDADNQLLDYVVAFTIGILYYTFFEGVTNRSIGKYFTGTKVVNENGETPDFGSILARSLLWFVPFNAFSFLGKGVG